MGVKERRAVAAGLMADPPKPSEKVGEPAITLAKALKQARWLLPEAPRTRRIRINFHSCLAIAEQQQVHAIKESGVVEVVSELQDTYSTQAPQAVTCANSEAYAAKTPSEVLVAAFFDGILGSPNR